MNFFIFFFFFFFFGYFKFFFFFFFLAILSFFFFFFLALLSFSFFFFFSYFLFSAFCFIHKNNHKKTIVCKNRITYFSFIWLIIKVALYVSIMWKKKMFFCLHYFKIIINISDFSFYWWENKFSSYGHHTVCDMLFFLSRPSKSRNPFPLPTRFLQLKSLMFFVRSEISRNCLCHKILNVYLLFLKY